MAFWLMVWAVALWYGKTQGIEADDFPYFAVIVVTFGVPMALLTIIKALEDLSWVEDSVVLTNRVPLASPLWGGNVGEIRPADIRQAYLQDAASGKALHIVAKGVWLAAVGDRSRPEEYGRMLRWLLEHDVRVLGLGQRRASSIASTTDAQPGGGTRVG